MKVLIPVVNHKDEKNIICKEFDDAKYYCIYDSLNKTYEWEPVSSFTNKIGNISFALKRKGILSVIVRNMPIMAVHLFTEMGIKLYPAEGKYLYLNIELLNHNKLSTLFFDKGSKSDSETENCSTSCSSCNSGC
jgi:predicted Fe-Mo cluster-binding NifX family protein